MLLSLHRLDVLDELGRYPAFLAALKNVLNTNIRLIGQRQIVTYCHTRSKWVT